MDVNLIVASAVVAYRFHTDGGEGVDDVAGDSTGYGYAGEGAVDYCHAIEGAGAAFAEEVAGVGGAGCDEGCNGGEGFVVFKGGGVVDCAEEEDFGFWGHGWKARTREDDEEERRNKQLTLLLREGNDNEMSRSFLRTYRISTS